MKKKVTGLLLALALLFTEGRLSGFAANSTVTGDEPQSKEVKVTAELKSMYSVSLPATITLSYSVQKESNNKDVPGYWYRLRYGTAGKVNSTDTVYVRPFYPCALTGKNTGAVIYLYSLKGDCKTEWDSTEVGTCTYNGTSLTNCVYHFCCNSGHFIGISEEDIEEYDSYEGSLIFDFGIE